MGKINGFKDLLVWQKGIDLAVEIYSLTSSYPSEEKFGLVSQSRNAATSVSLNIAEGYGRATTKSYVAFLRNAKASLNELETALIIAQRLQYIKGESFECVSDLIIEEQRMLTSLIQKIKENPNN